MACALATRRLTYWTHASARALALVALAVTATAAQAAETDARTILVFPVQSHWLSEPLARKVDRALVSALSQAGFTATTAAPSAVRPPAIEDGWVLPEDLQEPERPGARHTLTAATGLIASLRGELSEGAAEVSLTLELAGAVSQQSVSFEVRAAMAQDRDRVAAELARETAEAITPERWAEAGADEAGRREGAAARYAAGREALSQGDYPLATREFEIALIGDPDNPDYLGAAAEAMVARRNYDGALARLRRLTTLRPDVLEARLWVGDVALLAGRPEQAEAAFLAASAQQPTDVRALEGLARAARARQQSDRAQGLYNRLVGALPALAGEPAWLPGLLASRTGDELRLTGLAEGEIHRQLGQLYLEAGELAEGIRALQAYHAEVAQPTYPDECYPAVAAGLDAEADRIARRVQTVFAATEAGQVSDEQVEAEMTALHDRSERLAALAEQVIVSAEAEPGHRHRELAYNLLNQSNFETLMYVRTRDEERQRRADLLRDAFRKSRAEASRLGQTGTR